MKIRSGFVSNSSSSSFVAWGRYLEDLEDVEFLKDKDIWDLDFEELELDGSEYSRFLGLSLEWFMKKHPNIKLSEIPALTAKVMNQELGTNYTADDISYTEQGWYNG